MLQFAVLNAAFVGATAVLGPVVADASFGRAAWGLVVAALSVGLAVGAVVALRWHPRHALGIGVALMVVAAVPVLTLALRPSVPALIVSFAVAGAAIEVFSIAWDQSLQTNVPRDVLARVYSYDAVGSVVAVPFGEALVGPLAHTVGTTPTLLGCAVLIVVATVAAAVDAERPAGDGPGGSSRLIPQAPDPRAVTPDTTPPDTTPPDTTPPDTTTAGGRPAAAADRGRQLVAALRAARSSATSRRASRARARSFSTGTSTA